MGLAMLLLLGFRLFRAASTPRISEIPTPQGEHGRWPS